MARAFVNASSEGMHNTSAILSGPPITIACFFITTNDAAVLTLACLSNSTIAGNWILLTLRGDGGDKIEMNVNDGTTNAFPRTTTTFTTGTLHHACGIHAAANDTRVFIDGGSKNTSTTSTTPTVDDTRIGTLNNGGTIENFFDGDIAEVGIWNVALTDPEVLVLSTGMSPLLVRPSSLVGYWPLIGRYSPEIDRVGRFDMTLDNTPAFADHPRMFYPISMVSWFATAAVAGFVPYPYPRYGLSGGMQPMDGGA